jgi:S1-C subfamily serine protease
MRARNWLLGLLGAACLAAPQLACAAEKLPAGLNVPKEYKLPSATTLAVYIPTSLRHLRYYMAPARVWLQPGSALEGGVSAVTQQFFGSSFVVEAGDERPFGLLLDLHPQPSINQGTVTMLLNYKVLTPDGTVVLEGKQSADAAVGDFRSSGGLHTAAAQAAQLIVIELLNKLQPDAVKYPPKGTFKDLAPEKYVDREKPVSTGTGFFINPAGQIVTAAHVTEDCAILEAKQDDTALLGKVVASSNLVDLAVLDTGKPAEHTLALRKGGEIQLGEPVVNVGYPLQPILASSPNLTRGNISSRGALEGSLGQFQFSAPIQPGSSGGPVVSDKGELLGVTQSTLNVSRLIQQGVVPQNVNFALNVKYVAMFLQKNQIAFAEIAPTGPGDSQKGNEAALSSTLRLSCYQ